MKGLCSKCSKYSCLFQGVQGVSCNLLFHSSAGMCNPRNYSDTPPTSKSTVEELHEPIPSLFRALTEGDTQLNWNIVSFPVAEELSHHENLVSFLETVNQPQHQNVSVPSNNVHAPYSSDKGMNVVSFLLSLPGAFLVHTLCLSVLTSSFPIKKCEMYSLILSMK